MSDMEDILAGLIKLITGSICDLPDGTHITMTIPIKQDCGLEITFKKV